MFEPRKLLAEFLGSAFLLISIVGSGIMAQNLSGGNIALALLANAIATGCALYVLITIFGPISGAHFNPVVTLSQSAGSDFKTLGPYAYIGAQTVGAILGVWAAHAMFDLTVFQASTNIRVTQGTLLSEVIASFGLILLIKLASIYRAEAIPALVAFYITGAYWFTSSTSFANPSVTIARSLSETFAGIAPSDVAPFIAMQLIGALLAMLLARLLIKSET